MQLTRDTSKLLAAIYKTYLDRRNCGYDREKSKNFEPGFFQYVNELSQWSDSDINDCLAELSDAHLIKMNIVGGFNLENTLIVYMENRFKTGIPAVVKYISDLSLGIATSFIIG